MTTALPPQVAGFLEADNRFERVPADPVFAATVMASIVDEERLLVGMAIDADLWTKAVTLSYDAARKSVEAYLLHRGWRVRAGTGSHVATVAAAEATLDARVDDPAAHRISRSFGAARKARIDDEYPNAAAQSRSSSELRALVQDAWRLVARLREDVGADVVADLVP